MSRHPRRNHTAPFKAKVALAAIKGEKQFRNWRSCLMCTPTRLRSGRTSFWRAQSGYLEARRGQGPRRLLSTSRPSTPRSAS
jgi:hypothetical protein